MSLSIVENIDCMVRMREAPDNYWDLAICDPPYGINFDGEVPSMVLAETKRHKPRQLKGYIRKDWDKEKPSKEYFQELFRVSKNQIIWGGNHFELPQSSGWIIWNKLKPEAWSLAPCEMAWTSFDKIACRMFTFLWHGFQRAEHGERFHPTQKPVALYKWLLKNYAKQGDTIFDSHLGSQSSRIAAYDLGFDFVGCEKDKDYFDAGNERFARHIAQAKLFEPVQEQPLVQASFL